MSLFGSRVILASMKGQFWKSESKSNFKRLSLLKKKRESSAMRERGKKREKIKERKEKQEEKV